MELPDLPPALRAPLALTRPAPGGADPDPGEEPGVQSGGFLLLLAAAWVGSAVGAAREAASRGYPVIWASLVMGPVGWLAMRRLTRMPRPPLESRHALLQWATLAEEGLPTGPLPPSLEPRLLRLGDLARSLGCQPAFASALRDLVGFERLWDRMLPWLVLNLSLAVLGAILLGASALVAVRSSSPPLAGTVLLALLPAGWRLWRLARDPDGLDAEALLARGEALHLALCAARAGEPLPSQEDPEPLAREARQAVAVRLQEARRTGRWLGALLALAVALLAALPGL